MRRIVVALVMMAGLAANSSAKDRKWNVYMIGEGRTKSAAVSDLVYKTSTRETALTKDCLDKGGEVEWSDVDYPKQLNYAKVVRARQNFICHESINAPIAKGTPAETEQPAE
jgi:hypothetical protein